MIIDGPDGTYELTKEGFKEVSSSSTDPDNSNQTAISGSLHKQAGGFGTNYKYATGKCFSYGRKRDPVPWASFEFTINQNIDVVYPKIIEEFGFMSLHELKYFRNRASNKRAARRPDCKLHFRYEETPGNHYLMRRYIKHAYGQEEAVNTIEVDLAYADEDNVKIQVSYYSGRTLDKAGYEASLKQRILEVL
jgi:hypothetical protein